MELRLARKGIAERVVNGSESTVGGGWLRQSSALLAWTILVGVTINSRGTGNDERCDGLDELRRHFGIVHAQDSCVWSGDGKR